MTQSPERMQRFVPMLAYADAPAALEFLGKAFGFEETFRLDMPDGSIGHAEVGFGDSVVTLATSWDAGGFVSPRDLPGLHSQIMCYVDDVDAHYERARAAGAIIIAEPEDQFHGDRTYRAIDPEGHRWIFATRVRDVAPEDMKPE